MVRFDLRVSIGFLNGMRSIIKFLINIWRILWNKYVLELTSVVPQSR
jgi:hypothetical protein